MIMNSISTRHVVLLQLVVAALTPWSTAAISAACEYQGKDFTGMYDIAESTYDTSFVRSAFACVMRCADTNGCNVASYWEAKFHKSGQNCFLKQANMDAIPKDNKEGFVTIFLDSRAKACTSLPSMLPPPAACLVYISVLLGSACGSLQICMQCAELVVQLGAMFAK